MRFALYSDLHNECGVPWEPPESALQADVVVLAGDIGSHTHGLEWAARRFPKQPIVYVAGNHEYYDAQLGLLSEFQKPFWEQMDVHFLDRQSFEIDGVRFLGCTLWSAFDLHGADQADAHMAIARRSINDYRMIRGWNGKRLEPRDTRKRHQAAVSWLDAELAKPFAGKTVVVTHFAPHRGCVAPEHQGSDVSPYFVTDLAWLMEKHQIDVWCYGHTHSNISFVAENGCRVVANQRGYPGAVSGEFNPRLVIDLDDPTASMAAPSISLPTVEPRADGYVYREDIPQPWRGEFMRALRDSHQTRLLVQDRPIDSCFYAAEWRDWIATK